MFIVGSPPAEATRARRRRSARRLAALAVLALVQLALGVPARLAGEVPAEQSTPTFSDEVQVAWILVPVIVKGPSGYLNGLEREDFDLKVDGRSIRFPDFEPRGEAPWSLVFLQDLSGSMGVGGRLEASHEAIDYFLDAARPGDEFSLATFAGEDTNIDVPFTEDLEALRESVASWEGYGKTALHDAVALLPRISGDSRNVKRAVVLITDGVDNASTVTAAAAREIVRQAQLPVYVFGLESGDPFAAPTSADGVYSYADMLNLLAHMTGGRYFAIASPDDMKEACASVAEDLRYQYVLGFETQGTGKNAFRTIQVQVRAKKARQVLSRKGYQGLPPASGSK
ncbi:MAG: VWA domain-containing protein [Thermoanaerobaculia bacterium]|jgi:VWFA-related protein|nr:VWA domain-containing protein [Thermoanaerobaculia bacterium]